MSSPGTDSGMVNGGHPWPALLRVNTDQYQRTKKEVHEKVAVNFQRHFGDLLFRFVGIGKEPVVMSLLMAKLMHMAPVDLRPLLGCVPIYDTAKHIQRLGIADRLPALGLSDRRRPDKFLKQFTWTSVAHTAVAEGMGVNVWALLLLASLLGTDEIHVNNIRQVSMEILSLLLALSPSAATPGNLVPVRCFNDRTLRPQAVVVPKADRPEHFLRPLRDDRFATTGEFWSCPMVRGHSQDAQRQMPEDTLHMSMVIAAANRLLFCPWQDVPPGELRLEYQVIPDRHYSILRQGSDDQPRAKGSLRVNARECVIRYDGEEASLNVMRWCKELGELGFLMTPMVFRSGALVSVEHATARMGCLVPDGTRESILAAGLEGAGHYVGNFDFLRLGYHALVGPDGETVFVDVEDVWKNLVAPGTVLYIAPNTPSWLGLKGEFPTRLSGEDEVDLCALRVRLNVPTVLVSAAFAPPVAAGVSRGVGVAESDSRQGVRHRDGAQARAPGQDQLPLSHHTGGPVGARHRQRRVQSDPLSSGVTHGCGGYLMGLRGGRGGWLRPRRRRGRRSCDRSRSRRRSAGIIRRRTRRRASLVRPTNA